jgi:hypothetical protein
MAALHERHYRRPPGTTKTRRMGDDLLACVLGGVHTDVEKTLIELERDPIVRPGRGGRCRRPSRSGRHDRGLTQSAALPG